MRQEDALQLNRGQCLRVLGTACQHRGIRNTYNLDVHLLVFAYLDVYCKSVLASPPAPLRPEFVRHYSAASCVSCAVIV